MILEQTPVYEITIEPLQQIQSGIFIGLNLN